MPLWSDLSSFALSRTGPCSIWVPGDGANLRHLICHVHGRTTAVPFRQTATANCEFRHVLRLCRRLTFDAVIPACGRDGMSCNNDFNQSLAERRLVGKIIRRAKQFWRRRRPQMRPRTENRRLQDPCPGSRSLCHIHREVPGRAVPDAAIRTVDEDDWFTGLSGRDWAIFGAATVVSNLFWILGLATVIEAVRWMFGAPLAAAGTGFETA